MFVSKEEQEKIIQIFSKYPEDLQRTSLFAKSFCSMLMPYETIGISEENDVDKDKINQIISKLDYQQLTKFKSLTDFLEYILDFFSDKILAYESFKKILMLFAVT